MKNTHVTLYSISLYYMLLVCFHIKYKVVINTSNFDKDVRRHMTNMTVLAIKEKMRYNDAGKEIE